MPLNTRCRLTYAEIVHVQVGRKFSSSSNSKKSTGPGLLQRLTSRTSRRNSMQIDDRDISLRELMLETPPEVGTPFTERRGQNTENMHNAQVQPQRSIIACCACYSPHAASQQHVLLGPS